MCGSGAVSCSCSLLIRGPILPAVRQKLHLSPCADSRNRLSIPVQITSKGYDQFAKPSLQRLRHAVKPLTPLFTLSQILLSRMRTRSVLADKLGPTQSLGA